MQKNRQTTLRIIGGKWRGRKLKVCQSQYIRPTPNRVRETLFNWLALVIKDAICLDMFAGSGALGFEALSRGAKQVVMIDQSRDVIKTLKENAKILNTIDVAFWHHKFTCRGGDHPAQSEGFPAPTTFKFDVVFLDPPFHQEFIGPCCRWLEYIDCLQPNAFIYVEAEKKLQPLPVPVNWELYKHKVAGQVNYSLWQRS